MDTTSERNKRYRETVMTQLFQPVIITLPNRSQVLNHHSKDMVSHVGPQLQGLVWRAWRFPSMMIHPHKVRGCTLNILNFLQKSRKHLSFVCESPMCPGKGWSEDRVWGSVLAFNQLYDFGEVPWPLLVTEGTCFMGLLWSVYLCSVLKGPVLLYNETCESM